MAEANAEAQDHTEHEEVPNSWPRLEGNVNRTVLSRIWGTRLVQNNRALAPEKSIHRPNDSRLYLNVNELPSELSRNRLGELREERLHERLSPKP